MPKKYVVELTADERRELESLVSKGKAAARKRQHAQLLLKTDSGPFGPAWTDERIGEAFLLSVRTVERVRQRLVEHGLDDALERRQPCRTKPRRFDGEQEARLIAVACSQPPEGRQRWTLRLLAEKVVALEIVDQVDHTTVGRMLKKTNSSLG